MLYPILKPKVKYRYIAVAIALIVMTACSDQKPPTYQGYVEGEFVYVSSSESGRLDRLLVTRGQQVTAKTPHYSHLNRKMKRRHSVRHSSSSALR